MAAATAPAHKLVAARTLGSRSRRAGYPASIRSRPFPKIRYRGHMVAQPRRSKSCKRHQLVNGMLLPAGGAKGFALGLIIDLLCGLLAGGAWGDEAKPLYRNVAEPYDCSCLFIAIDAVISRTWRFPRRGRARRCAPPRLQRTAGKSPFRASGDGNSGAGAMATSGCLLRPARRWPDLNLNSESKLHLNRDFTSPGDAQEKGSF